ncbi:MAG: hypothetical protein P1Q69_20500, partial [Candidatus Thorarchaeota archaeon]|nr:hypothetical protein [Candidatus Thorarchaeota archaeon]
GRDTAFIDKEGFSFFQFSSSSIANLILTQLTFMALGGLLSGFSGIRTLVSRMGTGTKQAVVDVTATLGRESTQQEMNILVRVLDLLYDLRAIAVRNSKITMVLSYLGKMDRYTELVARIIWGQIVHLAVGSVFLLGASALSTSLVGSLFVSGLMISMTYLGIKAMEQIREMGPTEYLKRIAIYEGTPISKNLRKLWSAITGKMPELSGLTLDFTGSTIREVVIDVYTGKEVLPGTTTYMLPGG